MYIVSYPAK